MNSTMNTNEAPNNSGDNSQIEAAIKKYRLLSLIVGFISYWSYILYWIFTTRSDIGGAASTWIVIIVFFTEMVLGTQDKKIKFIGPTGTGIMLGWITEVIFSSAMPDFSPVNHQFLPLEPVMLALFIIPSAAFGSFIGKTLIFRFLKHTAAPTGKRVVNLLFLIAFILALASPISVPGGKSIKESKAKARTIEITRSQLLYAQDHRDEGFTCDLSKLTGSKSHKKESNEGFTSENQFILGYHYQLWCYPGGTPRKKFALDVKPFSVATSGDVGYCSNESGEVRLIHRRKGIQWGDDCRKSKHIIATISSSD